MSWTDTPIFLTNRNRFNVGFKDQIDWWLAAGMTDITVVDNGSSYLPLLKFYEELGDRIKLIRPSVDLGERGGWAFWDLCLHEQHMDHPVIVGDSDCVPDKDCPKDAVKTMLEVFEAYPDCKKVSFGVRIDDLPDHFSGKEKAVGGEKQYWEDELPPVVGLPTLYNAHTDTTTTLHRTGAMVTWNEQQFRAGFPFVIQHRTWYLDSKRPSSEEIYYKRHLGAGWTQWQ